MKTSNEYNAEPLHERMCFVSLGSPEMIWPAIDYPSWKSLLKMGNLERKVRNLLFMQFANHKSKDGETVALLIGKTPDNSFVRFITNTKDKMDFIDTYYEVIDSDNVNCNLKIALEESLKMFTESFQENESKAGVEELKLSSTEAPVETPKQRGRPKKTNEKSKQKNKQKNKGKSKEKPKKAKKEDFSTEIRQYDEWNVVWKKLQYKGWSWDFTPAGRGLGSDRMYIFPGGKKKGVEGVDYFLHLKSLKSYVREQFRWKGEGTPSPIEVLGKRTRAPSRKKSTIIKKNKTKRERLQNNNQEKSEKNEDTETYLGLPQCDASPSPATRKLAGSRVSHVERADDSSLDTDQSDHEFDFDENNHASESMSFSDQVSLESEFLPDFPQVWSILKKKLKFKEIDGLYTLPKRNNTQITEGENAFSTENDLRKHLVLCRVPGSRGAITEIENTILMRWLSLAHLSSEHLDLPLLPSRNIWKVLKDRNFTWKQSSGLRPAMYILPNVTLPTSYLEINALKGKKWVEKVEEFKELFCRYGVPGDDNVMKYRLAKWAVHDCHFEIFTSEENSLGSRGNRRRARENKEWEQAKSMSDRPRPSKRPKRKQKSTVASTIITDGATEVSSVTHTISTFKTAKSQLSKQKIPEQSIEPEETISDKEAFEILRKCFQFKSKGTLYVLPNVKKEDSVDGENTFNSLRALRLHLLKHRIPTTFNNLAEVDEESKMELSRWLACTHVSRDADDVKAITDRYAWTLLKKRGFMARGECYVLPGKTLGGEMTKLKTRDIDWFEKLAPGGIQEWCCVNGIPLLPDENGRGNTEDIQLANWASSYPFDAFFIIDDSGSERKTRTPRTPRSTTSSSFSPVRIEKRKRTTFSKNISLDNIEKSDLEKKTKIVSEIKNEKNLNISNNFLTQGDLEAIDEESESSNQNEELEQISLGEENVLPNAIQEMPLMTQAEDVYETDESGSNAINEAMEVEAENDPQLDGNNNVTEIEERFSNGTEDAQDTPQGIEQGKRNDSKDVEMGGSSITSDQVESSLHDNDTQFSDNMMDIDNVFSDEESLSEREYLDSCLSRLNLTFDTNNGESVFRREQTEETKKFIEEAVKTVGFTRGSKKNLGSILHLCGAPGTGKTTAVRRCINELSESLDSKIHKKTSLLSPYFDVINCSHLQTTSYSKLKEHFFSTIEEGLGFKVQHEKEMIEKRLHVNNSNKMVVLVLDEIDLLVSLPGAIPVLDMLFRWSLSPTHTFTIIGISNVVEMKWMNKFHIDELQENLTKIVFPPYEKEDLIHIVQKRVGTRTFDNNALELAGRKIATASGDARAMLNLAAGAVRKYQEMFQTANEYNKIHPSNMDPLIKLRHMMKAVRGSVGKKQSDHINSLPEGAKQVLCVAVTLGHCLGSTSEIPVYRLKKYVAAATQNGMFENLSNEHFIEVLDLLIDSGLLLVGGDHRFVDESNERMLKLGVQLDDVECALETTLFQKDFYRRLKEHLEDEIRKGHL